MEAPEDILYPPEFLIVQLVSGIVYYSGLVKRSGC